jgi:hypothetical protein
MRRACDALLLGDIFTAMADLSQEALADVVSLSTGVAAMPTPTGYVIDAHEEHDGRHDFRVRFQTNLGEIAAAASWRQIDGLWKIAALKVDSPPA